MSPDATDQIDAIQAHRAANRSDLALAAAWAAYDAAPDDQMVKAVVAYLLQSAPEAITADRLAALKRLLIDPAIDPAAIAPAGWAYLLKFSALFSDPDPALTAARLETDGFAQELLAQDLATLQAETRLTELRRWLCLSGRWRDFPRSVEALARQAALSQGAWPFDADERAVIDEHTVMARAYRPDQPVRDDRATRDDPVTRAVAAQYEAWPYPQWRRVTASAPTTLPARIRKFDPDGPDTLPRAAEILIAGCGTGRQAAQTALRYPDAAITAIDLSEASLHYAAARCAELGLRGIRFHALDLHRVADLGRRFDAVFCAGVLHHLPDPEAGWAALTQVLNPGGVMHVMVYSKIARLSIQALRASIADLDTGVVDEDLLREVRRRIMTSSRQTPVSRDFYSLSGVHDMLLHRHEDPFDVPRIQRALDQLGLTLIGFRLPSPRDDARYLAANPHDPLHRDFAAWARTEMDNPRLFARMYDFWCRKPAAS